MAQIREELILYDSFTNTFTKYIQYGQQAAGVTNTAKQATNEFTQSQRTASNATGGLTQSIKGLVGAYAGLQGIRKLLDLSDTITSTTARLNMMNDGLQTTAELNQMIFESAQRSRGAYAQTASFVAKLGNLAGDAFSSNREIIDFAEQINKQITLSGASNTEASAAIYQLTQGLSSGVLRGEELNSVMEQTPMIAKTIADYMGVTTGEMRELASEGKVTAEVVKNAMFAAAEETNAKFEQMPMTWGQVWTQFQNIAIQALQPVLQAISWLAQNLDIVGPIVLGVGTAFLVFKTAANWTNICAAATKALTAAQTVLGTVMATTWGPVLIVIIAIVAGLYSIVAVINKVTGSTISATGIITGAISVALAFVGNMFITVINIIIGAFALVYNIIADVANLVGNVFIDPLGTAARLFIDFADVVLGVLQGIASAIDFIFGSDWSQTIQGWRNDMKAWATDTFGESKEFVAKLNAEDLYLDQLDYGEAWNSGYNWGANLFSSNSNADNPFQSPDYTPYMEDTSKNVKDIKNSVSATEEDIQSLVDVAERRYVNNINLTAQTPVITVNGANTGHTAADRQNLANTIRDILIEQSAAGSVRTTARAF
nr:MAG TPA: Tail tape measure [Caudoviricetes sp.]